MYKTPTTLLAFAALPFLLVGCELISSLDGGTESSGWTAPDGTPGAGGLAAECAPISVLSCGSYVSGDTTDPNSGYTDVIDGWEVAPGNFDGPEVAWKFVSDYTGEVTFELDDPTPTEVNHDLFVLAGDGACRADRAMIRGHNEVTFDAVAGESYYLVLDGYDGDAGEFAAQVVCEDEPPVPAPSGDGMELTSVVRISTEVSPSWVAWSEIELFGVWASDEDASPFNLAAFASVQVSSELGDSPGEFAIDGQISTIWNSGDFAPAWIELLLPEPALIFEVRLGVAQTPSGATRHRVEFGSGAGDLSTVHTFDADTAGGTWLSWNNSGSWGDSSCQPLELNLIMEQVNQACPDCQIWFWDMGVPEQRARLELHWSDSSGNHVSNYSAGPHGTDGPLWTTRILAEPPWWGPGACPPGDSSCVADFLHHFEARGTLDGAPLWHGMLRGEMYDVPCDATITQAKLHLHINEHEGLANADHSSVVSFYRGTRRWQPEMVHGLQYGTDPNTGAPLSWTTPGGDFGSWVLDLRAQQDFWDRGFNKANPAAWFDFTNHLAQLQQER